MSEVHAKFLDQTGVAEATTAVWPALKVPREQIEAEIARLAGLPTPSDGVRRSLVVHPSSKFRGLTPTIRAAIEVVLPGERTPHVTRSSSCVELCIGGAGIAEVDGVRFDVSKHDTWTVPNLTARQYEASGSEPFVRLVFSDEPLLEYLAAHYVNDGYRAAADGVEHVRESLADYAYPMPSGGGALKTYAGLMDPEVIRHHPKCWKWDEVKAYLDGLDKSGPDYRSAIIALLWDESTGRVNGSTNTLTAFISGGYDPTWVEGKYRMARSHRPSMAAINYAFAGDWQTVVEGQTIRWGAGDLVLTAPAWALHTNGSSSQQPYTFAMQDAALMASMNASVVQEYVGQQPILIGSHAGFNTSIDTEHADELIDV